MSTGVKNSEMIFACKNIQNVMKEGDSDGLIAGNKNKTGGKNLKQKRTISGTVSLVLCVLTLFGSVTQAYGSTAVDINSYKVYTENINSLSPEGKTQIQSIGSIIEVRPPFIIAPVHSKASFFSSIVSWVFVYTNVTVEGYDGNYVKVRVDKTGETGYIHNILLTEDEGLLVQKFSNVYVGRSKKILKDYNNPEDFRWSVSQEGIISLNKQTGEIKGLSPGTVVVTAKYNGQTNKCVVSSINQWKETESSAAAKDIAVKSNPDSNSYSNFDKGTITKGTTVVARGDMADGSGWIYVSDEAEKIWGFIKLSDFPAIKYMMTQYHYYDEGYNKRFSSASTKIADYASVLNDVMMENFGLKVCYYIEPYTSAADQCKIWKYGSGKYLNNLSGSCPKTGNHNPSSCLRTTHIRDVLLADKGWGTNVTTKTVWTGHIMDGHKPSNSESTTQTIVFTTANTVSYSSGSYSNKSSSDIRYYSLYEITHETGHQLGLVDGYCYGKPSEDVDCSNPNCYSCNDLEIPTCIMAKRFSPEKSTVIFCDECISKVKNHLSDHH